MSDHINKAADAHAAYYDESVRVTVRAAFLAGIHWAGVQYAVWGTDECPSCHGGRVTLYSNKAGSCFSCLEQLTKPVNKKHAYEKPSKKHELLERENDK